MVLSEMNGLNGFEKLKDRKRNSIKQAAFTLFSSYGIKDVKITDNTKLARVSQVTIYNHFDYGLTGK